MKTDRDFIIKIISVKVVIVVIVVLLIFPVFPIADTKNCVTTPCPQEKFVSGIDLLNPPEPEPVFCIELFDPVCGVDGITYSNQCFADGAGVDVQFIGECG